MVKHHKYSKIVEVIWIQTEFYSFNAVSTTNIRDTSQGKLCYARYLLVGDVLLM